MSSYSRNHMQPISAHYDHSNGIASHAHHHPRPHQHDVVAHNMPTAYGHTPHGGEHHHLHSVPPSTTTTTTTTTTAGTHKSSSSASTGNKWLSLIGLAIIHSITLGSLLTMPFFVEDIAIRMNRTESAVAFVFGASYVSFKAGHIVTEVISSACYRPANSLQFNMYVAFFGLLMKLVGRICTVTVGADFVAFAMTLSLLEYMGSGIVYYQTLVTTPAFFWDDPERRRKSVILVMCAPFLYTFAEPHILDAIRSLIESQGYGHVWNYVQSYSMLTDFALTVIGLVMVNVNLPTKDPRFQSRSELRSQARQAVKEARMAYGIRRGSYEPVESSKGSRGRSRDQHDYVSDPVFGFVVLIAAMLLSAASYAPQAWSRTSFDERNWTSPVNWTASGEVFEEQWITSLTGVGAFSALLVVFATLQCCKCVSYKMMDYWFPLLGLTCVVVVMASWFAVQDWSSLLAWSFFRGFGVYGTDAMFAYMVLVDWIEPPSKDDGGAGYGQIRFKLFGFVTATFIGTLLAWLATEFVWTPKNMNPAIFFSLGFAIAAHVVYVMGLIYTNCCGARTKSGRIHNHAEPGLVYDHGDGEGDDGDGDDRDGDGLLDRY